MQAAPPTSSHTFKLVSTIEGYATMRFQVSGELNEARNVEPLYVAIGTWEDFITGG